jgi:2-methylcitrate synthase
MSVQEASQARAAFKPKKSVALSGTPAGQHRHLHRRPQRQRPALSRLRHADLAEHCEFAEVAHLLIHGKLPTAAELAAYKALARPAQFAR